MSLVQVIVKSVAKAKNALGDLLQEGTLIRKTTNTYNVGTQTNVKATEEHLVDFVYEAVSVDEAREFQLRLEDVKIIMLDVPVIPDNGDTFVIGDVTYQVHKAAPVMAGNTAVICTVFLRK